MIHRKNVGARPQVTFTSDFHELVQGDLLPGPCVLRYDPLRLIHPEDAAHESHRIRAYVRFHPQGLEWQGTLLLPPGLPLTDLADPAGQGHMLETTFTIPEGCDELEVWFSCTHEDGQTHWDSDHGRNHWLRFGLKDIAISRAVVTPAKEKKAPQDALEFELTTPPKVDSVDVRWRLTAPAGHPRRVTPLVCVTKEATREVWKSPEGGIPVPKGATVAFDVVYRISDRTFTDDNQGRWYIAD